MDNNALLQKLSDERDIQEVLTRYCRAADRCDAELLRSVYWPDGSDDHPGFSGNAMDFVDWAIKLLKEHTVRTAHMISNIWIKLEGNIALVESYHLAYHVVGRADGTTFDSVDGGRYVDRFERRGGEWRIAERKAIIDWEQNIAAMSGEEAIAKLFSVDRRNRNDESYRMFANKTLK